MATSDKSIRKLHDNKVIITDPLPAEYEQALKDANLSDKEVEVLISLAQRLKNAEGAAGTPVSSCFVL